MRFATVAEVFLCFLFQLIVAMCRNLLIKGTFNLISFFFSFFFSETHVAN